MSLLKKAISEINQDFLQLEQILSSLPNEHKSDDDNRMATLGIATLVHMMNNDLAVAVNVIDKHRAIIQEQENIQILTDCRDLLFRAIHIKDTTPTRYFTLIVAALDMFTAWYTARIFIINDRITNADLS